MTMVTRGAGAVDWSSSTEDGLRIKGVSSIVLGWVSDVAFTVCLTCQHAERGPSSGPMAALSILSHHLWVQMCSFMSLQVFAPLCSGLLAAIIFGLLRTFVLRAKNSTLRSYFVLPPLTFGTFCVSSYMTCVPSLACGKSHCNVLPLTLRCSAVCCVHSCVLHVLHLLWLSGEPCQCC